MTERTERFLRIFLVVALTVVGITIAILPHWLRSGRNTAPVVLEASGWSYAADIPPDSIFILHRLHKVIDPELGIDLVRIGLVETLQVDTTGAVRIVLGLTSPLCPYIQQLARATLDTIINTPGVRRATVKIDPGLVR